MAEQHPQVAAYPQKAGHDLPLEAWHHRVAVPAAMEPLPEVPIRLQKPPRSPDGSTPRMVRSCHSLLTSSTESFKSKQLVLLTRTSLPSVVSDSETRSKP